MGKRNDGRKVLGINAAPGDLECLRGAVGKRDYLVCLGSSSEGCGNLMSFTVDLVANGGVDGLQFGSLEITHDSRTAVLLFLTVRRDRWKKEAESAIDTLLERRRDKALATVKNVVFFGHEDDRDMVNMFAGAMADTDFENNFVHAHRTN
jgi:hypothetical protein